MKPCIFTGILTCLFLTAFSHSSLRAQPGTIEGRVINTQREPVPDLHVTFENHPYADVTDTEGHFIIENIPSGKYVIILDHIAYQPQRIVNIQLSRDQQLNLNTITLEDLVGFN